MDSPKDTPSWPDSTIIVRGGEGRASWLARTVDLDGRCSVQADPAASFEDLAACLPHSRVRRTTLGALRAAGGALDVSHGRSDYHCDLHGVSPAVFDRGEMMRAMIEILADFNKLDADGCLILSRLAIHAHTPFEQIAEAAGHVLLVDYREAVEGQLYRDPHTGHWLGIPDWATRRSVAASEERPPVAGLTARVTTA